MHEDDINHCVYQARSHAFTDNAMFTIYCFNVLHRKAVSKSVYYAFKDNPETLEQLREALLDPDFKDDLARFALNPRSAEAKDMERWLHTLLSKARKFVPYSAEKSSAAFSNMLSANRFFASGAFFSTISPNSWEMAMMYRFLTGLTSNVGDLNGYKQLTKTEPIRGTLC
jgi:hypothetical protein